MSFVAALKFPYQNIPKILKIALSFTLAFVGMMFVAYLLSLVSEGTLSDVQIIFVSLLSVIIAITFLCVPLFLSGYGIRIIRIVTRGHNILPATQILRDIGRGIIVFFAAFLYSLPLIAIVFMVGSVADLIQNEAVSVFGVLIIVIAAIWIGLAFIIGMARYAIQEESGKLFSFGENAHLARTNIVAGLKLLGWQSLIAIFYAIMTQVFLIVFYSIINWNVFTGDTFFSWMAWMAGYLVGYFVIILFPQTSYLHLIAQFAQKIGLVDEKSKRKNDFATELS